MVPGIALATPFVIDTDLSTAVGTSDMNGMQVTINWHDGGSETFNWGSGITFTDGSLTFTGSNTSTMALDWELVTNTKAIDSFIINGNPGNVFFDILYSTKPALNTPGSDRGFWAPITKSNSTETSGSTSGTEVFNFGLGNQTHGADFTWAFSNPGYLSSASSFPDPPTDAHDLFEQLLIDFTSTGGFKGTFNFGVDTDKVEGGRAVPEPATMMLFGLGLLGLGVVGRKRTYYHNSNFIVDRFVRQGALSILPFFVLTTVLPYQFTY